jgi:hypothetical protein
MRAAGIRSQRRMLNKCLGRLGIAIVIALWPLAAATLPASAANGPAPGTGLTGACNMLLDPTMVTVAMTHDAANGNAGMFRAVAVSGC